MHGVILNKPNRISELMIQTSRNVFERTDRGKPVGEEVIRGLVIGYRILSLLPWISFHYSELFQTKQVLEVLESRNQNWMSKLARINDRNGFQGLGDGGGDPDSEPLKHAVVNKPG